MSPSAMGMQGRTALATGATGGVGREIVRALVEQGVKCVAHYRDDVESAQRLQRDFGVHLRRADLARGGAARELWRNATQDLGRAPDILINNAAIARATRAVDVSIDEWDDVFAVNLDACFALSSAALEAWRALAPEVGRRSIVNVGAASIGRSMVGATSYGSSKSALLGLTKSLAREGASHEIRVNMLSPGFVSAGMIGVVPSEVLEHRRQEIPLRRLGTPEEIAYMVLLLASPMAEYVTGQNWIVDGGWTC